MCEKCLGPTHRWHLAQFVPAVGCIGLRDLAQFLRRTLAFDSDRSWAKSAASRRIRRGATTASRKATPLPAGGLSNFVQLDNPQNAVGRCDLRRSAKCGSIHRWGRPGAVGNSLFHSSAGATSCAKTWTENTAGVIKPLLRPLLWKTERRP